MQLSIIVYRFAKKFVRIMRRVERKKKERFRFIWNDDATRHFLKLWLKYIDDLNGTRKKTEIHQEMADKLYKFGPSCLEVRAKIDNMTKKYRTEMLKYRRSREPSEWEYFDEVHKILKESKLVNLSLCMADSFDFSPMENSDSDDVADHQSKICSPPTIESTETEPPGSTDSTGSTGLANINTSANSQEHSLRILEIEEAKLSVQREKLKVLKNIADELSAAHRNFLKTYRFK